jgi:hypothetical protein
MLADYEEPRLSTSTRRLQDVPLHGSPAKAGARSQRLQ